MRVWRNSKKTELAHAINLFQQFALEWLNKSILSVKQEAFWVPLYQTAKAKNTAKRLLQSLIYSKTEFAAKHCELYLKFVERLEDVLPPLMKTNEIIRQGTKTKEPFEEIDELLTKMLDGEVEYTQKEQPFLQSLSSALKLTDWQSLAEQTLRDYQAEKINSPN